MPALSPTRMKCSANAHSSWGSGALGFGECQRARQFERQAIDALGLAHAQRSRCAVARFLGSLQHDQRLGQARAGSDPCWHACRFVARVRLGQLDAALELFPRSGVITRDRTHIRFPD
jgi:hypothetical protein